MTDLSGKIALITGGTGSFGNIMLKHALGQGCEKVRVFSRDEAKQEAMRRTLQDTRVDFYIGDVRDRDSVDRAMRGVDLVFHAAALKQVPSCEFFPLQAVKTNIIGSQNVIDSAEAHGVERVVCLSTDKAVAPVNAMGMSKAMMEKLVLAKALTVGRPGVRDGVGPNYNCVRYGNVLYSRGSVVPVFVRQAKANEPLTVTDPDMTRFLMPLRDSVALVEHAWTQGHQGDIMIKKAPASTIGDLAEAVKQLFGSSSDIRVIGTRHAEKKYETLASLEELANAEDMGDYIRVRMDTRDLNYDVYFSEGDQAMSSGEEYNSHNTERLNVEGIKKLLLTLPEIQRELAGEPAEYA